MRSYVSSRLRSLVWCAPVALGILATQAAYAQKKPAGVDFARDVRPILSDACFQCHGPDKSTRMADLRLDIREAAFAPRKNGAPIVPGDSRKSLIFQRITHPKPALRMPPPQAHKELKPEQIATIQKWIDSGAEWKEHWAFRRPVRPRPPAVTNTAWVTNPIDRFILAALEAKGLTPAPPADRRTLARRVALDLTGLPPDPADVEAFVKDTSPKAYETLVDRLLASPHWGEHRARYWLDAARYGDTHGLHIDNYREMWPYRDWVIKAFNANMPFDQFTIEQIAGDLLPNPSMDQLMATGFHRCNVTTNEGGVIPEEVAAMYAKDRVDTTGAVFLGLTVGCATCHDHKYDPISTRDFYSLTAFFRNTLQNPLDGNISDTPPVIVVPREEDRARWRQLDEEEKKAEARQSEIRKASKVEFEAWLGTEGRGKIHGPLDPADEVFSLSVPGEEPEIRLHNQSVPFDRADGLTIGEGHIPGWKALYFEDKGSLTFPNQAYFEADRPFAVSAWIYVPKGPETRVLVSQSDPDSKGRGWALELSRGIPSLRLTTQSNRSYTIRAMAIDRLKAETWHHVAFSYDGSRLLSGVELYLDGKNVWAEGRGNRVPMPGDFRTYAPLRVGSDGKRFNPGGAIADLRIFTRAITEEEAAVVASWPVLRQARGKKTEDLSAAEREALHDYYLTREYRDYVNVADELRTLREERKQLARRGAVTHIQMERRDQKPFAHILYRGMYDQPREKVEPAVPSALPPMPESYPKNRLGLAKWLVDENNPLTARVTVNRFWQEVFGVGLVKTAEDFGSQGELPSHPELLDWLAVEFRESGWDVKKLFKLMVMSSTYRQAAVATPEKLQKDPDNRFLSRGPRFRMDAEMIRDLALAASGLLNRRIGGPSVKPYQPEGVWEAVAMLESDTRFYKRDTGPNLYRRSMYTFWKRSAPPASMDIFNAPSRENCTVRRERTNTPLQALVTMNDTQFVEAARNLAELALQKGGPDWNRRLDFMTLRVLSRTLSLKEREILKKAHADYLNYYDSHPADAKKLLSVGESEAMESANPAELAALTIVANGILNLDEALNK